jgi:hypothetical protein
MANAITAVPGLLVKIEARWGIRGEITRERLTAAGGASREKICRRGMMTCSVPDQQQRRNP